MCGARVRFVLLASICAGLAALAHSSYSASQRVQDWYIPPGLEQQDGGDNDNVEVSGFQPKLFQDRPSDGQTLEFVDLGSSSPDARVWFFVHGAMSTGNVLSIWPGFERRMQELNVRVVAPTMPGWGTSDPYRADTGSDKNVFDVSGSEWLALWAQDSLALLDYLRIEKFTVTGMSLGGTPAIATAAAAARHSRLRALAPVIALTWNAAGGPEFDLFEHYSAGARLGMALLENRYLGSLAAELMRNMVLGTDAAGFENSPMLPPDVAWDRKAWGADMQRSVRYQLAGQVQSNRLPYSVGTEDPQYIDWTAFDRSTSVYVFFGEQDETVLPAVGAFAATQLDWAQLKPFNGSHFHLDIFDVANKLFSEE